MAETSRRRALLAVIPFVGHANPLIHQARELQRRGWSVALASVSDLRPHVERSLPGLEFIDLGRLGELAARFDEVAAEVSRSARFVATALAIHRSLLPLWERFFDGLTTEIWRLRPDVMVVDLVTPGALDAAEAAGVAVLVNNPNILGALSAKMLPPADHLPLPFSGKARSDVTAFDRVSAPLVRWLATQTAQLLVGRPLNVRRRGRGLPPRNVNSALDDVPVLVNMAFGLEYERPLPRNVHMVGPMIPGAQEPLPAELEAWLSDGSPVVYVNLGTLAVAPPALVKTMVHAFDDERFRTLWVMREREEALLPPRRPPGVRVVGWGPPLTTILAHERVRAFVSHCGINSVHESIHAGTPIVGVPMFGDQLDMAKKVADAGCGVVLDKLAVTADTLRAAIVRVMDDPAFRAPIPALQASFAKAGGIRRAVDLIEETADA